MAGVGEDNLELESETGVTTTTIDCHFIMVEEEWKRAKR